MSKPIPKIVWILPLGLVLALLAGWFILQWAVRGPLAGKVKHDFGVVEIPSEGKAILHHTFHLTSRKNRPLTIHAGRPYCACIKINAAFPIHLGPRQEVDLPITMEYLGSDPAGKIVLIILDCGEDGHQNLWVKTKPAYSKTPALPPGLVPVRVPKDQS